MSLIHHSLERYLVRKQKQTGNVMRGLLLTTLTLLVRNLINTIYVHTQQADILKSYKILNHKELPS